MSLLLLLRPQAVTGPLPTPEPPLKNILGCAGWGVKLYLRGGETLLGEVSFTGLTGERVRTSTPGQYSVSIPSASCDTRVRATRPWEHELHFYRAGDREFQGPVRRVEYASNGDAIIRATDLTGWLSKAPLLETVSYSADAAEIYANLAHLGFLACGVPNIQIVWGPVGVTLDRLYYASAAKLIQPLLDDLARSGVAAVMLERTLYVGSAIPVTTRSIRLIDSHFAEPPAVALDGDSQVNELYVAGGASSDTIDPVLVVLRDEASIDEFGLLAGVDRDPAIGTPAQATARGQDSIARSAPTPIVFSGGQLDESAPVLFDELVPSSLVGVTLSESPAPVADTFDLVRVPYSATPTAESVSVEVQPRGASSA